MSVLVGVFSYFFGDLFPLCFGLHSVQQEASELLMLAPNLATYTTVIHCPPACQTNWCEAEPGQIGTTGLQSSHEHQECYSSQKRSKEVWLACGRQIARVLGLISSSDSGRGGRGYLHSDVSL